MAEDIIQEPGGYRVLAANPNPYRGQESFLFGFNFSLDEIRAKVRSTEVSQLQRYPKLAREITIAYDVIYGPLRLSVSELAERIYDPMERRHSAQVQHAMAHNIVRGFSASSDRSYQWAMTNIVETMDQMASSRFGREYQTGIFWNGVRAETALINTLHRAGFRVLLPDYTILPGDVSYLQDEVLQWDVFGGVDIIAQALDGGVILIDVKGRLRDEKGKILKEPQVFSDTRRLVDLPSCLHQTLSGEGVTSPAVRYAKVVIPTHRDLWFGSTRLQEPVGEIILSGLK